MTVETIKIWVCNAADCDAKAPENTPGWYSGIYTHGCPDHARTVADHKADVTDSTSGRGSRAVTYWYLTCACGWTPQRRWTAWNSEPLRKEHLAHLVEQSQAVAVAALDQPGDQEGTTP